MNESKKIAKTAVSLVDGLNKGMYGLSMVIVYALVVLVSLEVLLRYAFNYGFVWSLEVVEFSMAALGFLMLARCQALDFHISIDALTTRLDSKKQAILKLVNTILVLAFIVILIWVGWQSALRALVSETKTEQAELPVFPLRLVVPVGSFVMLLQLIVDITRQVRSISSGKLSSHS